MRVGFPKGNKSKSCEKLLNCGFDSWKTITTQPAFACSESKTEKPIKTVKSV